MVLNADHLHDVELLQRMLAAGDVWFDFSMVEGVGGVGRPAQRVSIQRMLFGSHYPLYYFESALLKVQEAGFTEAERTAVLEGNARRLLAA